MSSRGRLVVISGPSGCGKTTVCRRLREDPRVSWSVSATTRPPKDGEVDGADYHFLDRATFEGWIAGERFIEYEQFCGQLYGTPRAPLEEALAAGRFMLVDAEAKGTLRLMKAYPDGLFIFLDPPSRGELRRRIEGRGRDSPEQVERRLESAAEQMSYRHHYPVVLTNDDLENTVARIRALMKGDAPDV